MFTTRTLGVIAGLVAVGAGVYLLTSQTQAQNSIFDVLLHGIGAYFIAKGLFIWRSLWEQEALGRRLEQLVEVAAYQLQREQERTKP